MTIGSTLASASAAFLLAFPALFSIVNPPGGAFIFNEVTADLTRPQRLRLAGKVGVYSLIVLLGALWTGSYVLNFFGISLGALRIAGGAVVVARAWDLLNAPEQQEARKQEQAEQSSGRDVDAIAFFPMTLPFTTGPGSISVAIALGAGRPIRGDGLLGFFIGMTGAALAIALCVWIAYGAADRIGGLMGPNGRRVMARLSAFLLMCIGTQILINGLEDVVPNLLHTS
jgi:multiple antibiotic resistance protein